jgi:3-methyladenine DNA glycosylase AlkD
MNDCLFSLFIRNLIALRKFKSQISFETPMNKVNPNELTASEFIEQLSFFKSKTDLINVQRFFRNDEGHGNKFFGVKMGTIFELAKASSEMPVAEIKKLLASDFYEARMGAVSIMDFQARNKKTSEQTKKKLFDLYIKQHKKINNWDLVDRSAPYVVGGFLFDKPRKILFTLAKSKNVWERRTAIVSTYYFIRQGDVADTFKIAEILLKDKHDLIQKAAGSWVREAGKKDLKMLINFLDKYSKTMPRTMLRYAIEKLDKKQREYYLKSI